MEKEPQQPESNKEEQRDLFPPEKPPKIIRGTYEQKPIELDGISQAIAKRGLDKIKHKLDEVRRGEKTT